jgi:excisionase family DNA binding protein
VRNKPDLAHLRALTTKITRAHGATCPAHFVQQRRCEAMPSALSFTIQDACRLTGIGRTTLFALLAEGRLRRIKIGTKTLVEGESLRALIQGREGAP